MKIDFDNLRYTAGREGIEIYPLPTIHVVLNEYDERGVPKWTIYLRWWWFAITIHSNKFESFRKKNKRR